MLEFARVVTSWAQTGFSTNNSMCQIIDFRPPLRVFRLIRGRRRRCETAAQIADDYGEIMGLAGIHLAQVKRSSVTA